nr:SRPBCC family protein [Pseudomonadales bacterium]
ARFSQGEIEVEGEGIGMIRHLKSAVGDIGEQLTSLDNETRQIGYRIIYGEPIGMKAYQALVTVITKGCDSCEINWSGMFEPIDPDTRDQVAEALAGSYQAMHKALESYTLARL